MSLDPYRRESVKILKIFSESCPLIEKASIDEAFLDFSIPARALLLARFPGLLSLEQLQDSSSNVSLDNEVPLPSQLDWNNQHSSSGNNIISTQSEEEHEQVVESSTTWTDVALLIGAELMAQCRKAVFDQLGYTCSAGIATNKVSSHSIYLTPPDLWRTFVTMSRYHLPHWPFLPQLTLYIPRFIADAS